MATASVTYTFTNGTNADAIQVNQNFTDILNFINASVVQTDGSTALASNAVTTAKIADSAVTSAKIAAEAWTSWTPTVRQSSSDLTNNLNYSSYYQIGKTVIANFRVQASSGSAVAGAIDITLPVPGKANMRIVGAGYLYINDASNNYYYNTVTWYGSGVGTGTQRVGALRGDRQETYVSPTTTNPLNSFNAARSSSSAFIGTIIYEAA